jgi:secondary thiamine-phosphate synthase enzyme
VAKEISLAIWVPDREQIDRSQGSVRFHHKGIYRYRKVALTDKMATFRMEKRVRTGAEGDIVDLTAWVLEGLRSSTIEEGIACVFAAHSTAAIVLIENEPGLREDLRSALQRQFPKGIEYAHNGTWGDGNGHAHIRATSLGQSVTFPFSGGEPDLGTWQQVVLVELDRARERQIVLQLVGD